LTPSDLSSTTGRLGHDPRLGAPAPNGTHTHASPHGKPPPIPTASRHQLKYYFPVKVNTEQGRVGVEIFVRETSAAGLRYTAT